ncbi:MAG: MoxR family ATPase [Saprospiraceae bacterium]|nr:MoxR family ATPase [Saprospiraceae bacterium]MBL0101460.1 MoxR family ATPase [Saprospiraceae bacterium]
MEEEITKNEMTQNDDALQFDYRMDMSLVHDKLKLVRDEIAKVIVGQEKMLDLLLLSTLANGHVLLEGVPGVAKTITAKLLARTLDVGFSRIQFTPDLMPSDILGTLVFDVKKSDFEYRKGPIFSNIVLIDEINRAPAKTQAALFEVMEERQITIDGEAHKMALPFLVIATQNPIEQEGTYRLPEAQLDRFLMKIEINYPELDDEIEIIHREHFNTHSDKLSNIGTLVSGQEILEFQALVRKVRVEQQIISYIAKIVVNTRQNALLYLGASPRASIAILNASKAMATIKGRDFVTPEDIKDVSYPVLGHRVVVAPEKEMEGITSKMIIQQIVESVEIPR